MGHHICGAVGPLGARLFAEPGRVAPPSFAEGDRTAQHRDPRFRERVAASAVLAARLVDRGAVQVGFVLIVKSRRKVGA